LPRSIGAQFKPVSPSGRDGKVRDLSAAKAVDAARRPVIAAENGDQLHAIADDFLKLRNRRRWNGRLGERRADGEGDETTGSQAQKSCSRSIRDMGAAMHVWFNACGKYARGRRRR
jgi:hypothetical protein